MSALPWCFSVLLFHVIGAWNLFILRHFISQIPLPLTYAFLEKNTLDGTAFLEIKILYIYVFFFFSACVWVFAGPLRIHILNQKNWDILRKHSYAKEIFTEAYMTTFLWGKKFTLCWVLWKFWNTGN